MPETRKSGVRIDYDDEGAGEPALLMTTAWCMSRNGFADLIDDCAPLLSQTFAAGPWAAGSAPPGGDHRPPVIPEQRNGSSLPRRNGDPGLTEQQQRIVRLIGEGMSNAEIAERLSVEVSTVKSHVSRVLQRLNLRDREQLIAHAWRSGLMDRGG